MAKNNAAKNELAPQAQGGVPAVGGPAQLQGLVTNDVIIPKLWLMQGTSDLVKERKAGLGDMVRSTTGEKLGDPDKPIRFIPLAVPTATWILEVRAPGAQRWEFRGVFPRNASNDTLAWRFPADKDGKEVDQAKATHEGRRTKALSLYAILPEDVKAEAEEKKKAARGLMPDLNKALTPILILFKSTSFQAGREISTFFTQAQSFGFDAWRYSLQLENFLDKNDQGTFYVYKVNRTYARPIAEKPEAPTPEEKQTLEAVEKWVKIVTSGVQLQVDEATDGSSEPGAPAAGGNGQF